MGLDSGYKLTLEEEEEDAQNIGKKECSVQTEEQEV